MCGKKINNDGYSTQITNHKSGLWDLYIQIKIHPGKGSCWDNGWTCKGVDKETSINEGLTYHSKLSNIILIVSVGMMGRGGVSRARGHEVNSGHVPGHVGAHNRKPRSNRKLKTPKIHQNMSNAKSLQDMLLVKIPNCILRRIKSSTLNSTFRIVIEKHKHVFTYNFRIPDISDFFHGASSGS